MEHKQRIQHLKNILNTVVLSDDQKSALERAIIILENYKTKDQLIEAAKILASLIAAGTKIFDS
jgi:hypothetical protein